MVSDVVLDARGDEIDALGPELVVAAAAFAPFAVVDLLPDPSWSHWLAIPEAARAAHEALAARAQVGRPRQRDPHFQVEVDLADERRRLLVGQWAAHSINVNLYRTASRDTAPALTFHDEGTSVSATISADELTMLHSVLRDRGSPAVWVPSSPEGIA